MAPNTQKQPEEKKEKVKRPTAQKRDLQSKKKALANSSFRSSVRTAVRALQTSLEKKESAAELTKKLNAIYSIVDKGAKTNVLKDNKAARMKSRLSARVNSISKG
jgi:small subunit ribosomal protein S20